MLEIVKRSLKRIFLGTELDRMVRAAFHNLPCAGRTSGCRGILFLVSEETKRTTMKTYIETDLENGTETEAAILRSISHNEIVRVECADPAQLADWISDNYDEVDHARENNGALDVWGKRNGEDFRLRIRNPNAAVKQAFPGQALVTQS